MPKGSFVSDTFEQLAEMGQSTAKKSVKAVGQTFNPLRMLEKTISTNGDNSLNEKTKNLEKNSSPLDFDKLQKKYQDHDKMKMESLRNRLFQMVKNEDEKTLERKKKEEEEKERKKVYETREKRRLEQQRKEQMELGEAPRGKQRKSLFSAKKVAKREQAEVKPATGKQ
jgi:hypothetical protein